jgi:DNA-binding GntR family transcriptional regulator
MKLEDSKREANLGASGPGCAPQKISDGPLTLREIVVDLLRSAITLGRFRSGERLVERTIGEQLGVRHTVVREALRYLESEELVELLPYREPIVARLDWAQAEQIYRIRLLFETNAAMACAERHIPEVAQELGEALYKIEQTVQFQKEGSFFEAATRFFHFIFVSARHQVVLGYRAAAKRPDKQVACSHACRSEACEARASTNAPHFRGDQRGQCSQGSVGGQRPPRGGQGHRTPISAQ